MQPWNSNGAASSSTTFNMSIYTNNSSDLQREEPSPICQTIHEEPTSPPSPHEDCHFLPQLDIEAANSSREQRKMSQWSAADSCWTSAPTAVEKSIEPSIRSSVEKDNLHKEKHNIQFIERSTPSLKPSSSDGKPIPELSLAIPAVPLTVEDPSKMLSMSLLRKIALVLVACSAQFLNLGGMNQTVAPVMVLADYFQIRDYGTLSWFSAAYSMSVGTFILPAGKRHVLYLPCSSSQCFSILLSLFRLHAAIQLLVME